MSLVRALGLSAPRSAAAPPPVAGASARPAPAGAPAGAPRRNRIVAITVAGRKRDLLGLVDRDGAVAQSGGKAPLDLLTSINRAAAELYRVNDTALLVRVSPWKSAMADVRSTASQASQALKKAEAGLSTGVARRRDKGGDFFEDVNEYLKALAEATALAREISAAQTDYEVALAKLDAAIGLQGYEEGKDDVEKKKGDLEAKKAELAEAQQIFGNVLEIGKKVLAADWRGLADQAMSYVKDKAEEAVRDAILDKLYAVEIDKLTKALDEARRKTASAKAQWLAKSVEAASLGITSAATRFDNARAKLRDATKNLARNQANAVGALKRDPSTQLLGALVEQRSDQLRKMAHASEKVRSVKSAADSVIGQANALRAQYARLPTEIRHLPPDHPDYRSDSPWAREVSAVAVINADLMVRVADAAGALEGNALVDERYLAAAGADGPLAPYDRAVAVIDLALQG